MAFSNKLNCEIDADSELLHDTSIPILCSAKELGILLEYKKELFVVEISQLGNASSETLETNCTFKVLFWAWVPVGIGSSKRSSVLELKRVACTCVN